MLFIIPELADFVQSFAELTFHLWLSTLHKFKADVLCRTLAKNPLSFPITGKVVFRYRGHAAIVSTGDSSLCYALNRLPGATSTKSDGTQFLPCLSPTPAIPYLARVLHIIHKVFHIVMSTAESANSDRISPYSLSSLPPPAPSGDFAVFLRLPVDFLPKYGTIEILCEFSRYQPWRKK